MTDSFVFLHGGGQGGWIWDETISALTMQSGGKVNAVALDAPGCGSKRGVDTSAMTFEDIIAELVDEITELGLDDFVLIGHSQAGTCLPRIAESLSEAIRRIIYVSCSAPDPGLTIAEMVQKSDSVGSRALYDNQLPPMERYRIMFCNDMSPAEADNFLAKLGKDQWPASCFSVRDWRYGHLSKLPSSYVVCLEDQILSPDSQAQFSRQLHAERVVRLDAGHQAQNTRPQALAEILLHEAGLIPNA